MSHPPDRRHALLVVALAAATAAGTACSSGDDSDAARLTVDTLASETTATDAPMDTDRSVTQPPAGPTSEPLPPDTIGPTSEPLPPDTTAPTSSTTSTTTSTSSTTTTTINPADVAHSYPVDPAVHSSFTPEAHANYRATDIFASAGCGTALLAPVTGEIGEVLRNVWDPAVNDPATRGGNAVSIVGDDGVRYYLAHFQLIDPTIVPGARVTAGDRLGEMGDTGRSSACHVHFGLSLPCDNGDWWVRRGVIWPDDYLNSWREGGNLSPLPELEAWFAEYPDACASPEGIPYPTG